MPVKTKDTYENPKQEKTKQNTNLLVKNNRICREKKKPHKTKHSHDIRILIFKAKRNYPIFVE